MNNNNMIANRSKTKVRWLHLKIPLQTLGQTRTLPHNVTHRSAGHGVESSEVDEGHESSLPIQSASCSPSCGGGWWMNFFVALCVQTLNSPRGYQVKGEVKPGRKWARPVGMGRSSQGHFGPVRPRFSRESSSCNCWLTPFCMWALDIVFSTV
jgi:hypothetical protein